MSYTLQQFINETHFIPGDTVIRSSCFAKEWHRHFEESERAFLYFDTYCIWLESDFSFPEKEGPQITLQQFRDFIKQNPNSGNFDICLQEDDRCTPTDKEGMFYYPEHKCIVVY